MDLTSNQKAMVKYIYSNALGVKLTSNYGNVTLHFYDMDAIQRIAEKIKITQTEFDDILAFLKNYTEKVSEIIDVMKIGEQYLSCLVSDSNLLKFKYDIEAKLQMIGNQYGMDAEQLLKSVFDHVTNQSLSPIFSPVKSIDINIGF